MGADSVPPLRKAPDFRQNEHEEKAWFDRRLPKAKVTPLLEAEGEGSFVVRDSSSNPGCFAFSYLADGVVQNKLIEESDAGFHFKACTSARSLSFSLFPSLSLRRTCDFSTNTWDCVALVILALFSKRGAGCVHPSGRLLG